MYDEVILATTYNSDIILWQLNTGTQLKTFSKCDFEKEAICHLNREYLAILPKNKKIISIWSIPKGKRIHENYTLEINTAIASSSDGKFIVSGSQTGILSIWNIKTGMLLKSFKAHYKSITKICFNNQNNIICTGSSDGNIHIWLLINILNTNQNQIIPFVSWSNHTLPILDLKIGFGEIGAIVVSSSLDHTCKIWNINTGKLLNNHDMPCYINSIDISKDEQYLYLAGQNGNIYELSLVLDNSNNEMKIFNGHKKAVLSVTSSSDMERIISGSEDATVKIWDARNRMCLRTLDVPSMKSSVFNLFLINNNVLKEKQNEKNVNSIAQLKKYGNKELENEYNVVFDGCYIEYSSLVTKFGLLKNDS